MQSNAVNEHELVKQCMQELCKKAGFANCESMVQRDLEFLCDSIESDTGVLISLSTMKRLANGQFSRQPQVATLNALANYLGYQSWQHFKLSKNGSFATINVKDGELKTEKIKTKGSNAKKYIYISCSIVIVLASLAALKFRKPISPNYNKAQFSAVKTTSNAVPNTVVFKYNVDDVNADSFFIQQSWDVRRRVRVYKNNYTLTDIYYVPGYHVAKLIANDSIIKAVGVSIPTDKWFFYAHEKNSSSLPKYISTTGIKDGCLQMNKQDLTNALVNTDADNEYVNVFFPSKIESSADNYILKCRLKVNPVKNNACPYLMCEVYCQRYFMYFINSSMGCSSEQKAQFGEQFISGKTTDLSAMATDVSQWQDIQLVVKNKQVKIRINNKDALSTSYSQTCGLVTGLGFISNGLCQVDSVELKSLDEKDIYSSNFDKNSPLSPH